MPFTLSHLSLPGLESRSTWLKSVYNLGLLVIAASIGTFQAAATTSIVVCALISLFVLKDEQKWNRIQRYWPVYLLYFPILYTILFHLDSEKTVYLAYSTIYLLLLPISLIYVNRKEIPTLIAAFVLSTCIIFFFDAILTAEHGFPSKFSAKSLFGIHYHKMRPIQGFIAVMSMIGSAFLWHTTKNRLWLALCVFAGIFTFWIGAKAASIAALLLIGITLFSKSLASIKKWQIGLVLSLLLLAFAFSRTEVAQRRIDLFLSSDIRYNPVTKRLLKWDCALDNTLNNETLIIGHGTGKGNQPLWDCYAERGYQEGANYQYNPHNQIISNLYYFGIVGLLAILAHIFILGYRSFTNRNLHLGILILLVTLLMQSENILHRNYTLFTYLFLLVLFSEWKTTVQLDSSLPEQQQAVL